ncbi:MAG: hypothetical protein FD138_2729 [Planctomycetota bacterium]|nr:MAG: hypothetical protein FD138_2729 [Planctomycetota bacterium]
MFFTPWLRSFSRRLRFPKRRQKRLSPQQHQKMLRGPVVVSAHAEGLEPRCLLVAPNFVSVSPNGGVFLTDGATLTEAPRELTFQFSPGHLHQPTLSPISEPADRSCFASAARGLDPMTTVPR